MFYSGLSKLFTSKNTPEHKLFPIPNGKSKKSINKRTEWLRAISIEGNPDPPKRGFVCFRHFFKGWSLHESIGIFIYNF